MAQPSSARNARNASSVMRNDRRISCKVAPRSGGSFQIGYCRAVCKGLMPQACVTRAVVSGSLDVGQELPHFVFETFGLDSHRVGQALDVGGSRTGVGGDAGDPAHRLGTDAG